ncbi:GTP 3',8-cyclase MoaA [Mariniblastus fucicola]|uniref:GTP 3',8-cyclase n=1 Tax=Mariniblastus fucicola TaxID=980251 RepID=A0A5B9PAB9_9BACT|nr:GTP 3',8-cyclase MoaA [Mariniblastus fucicola]QEG21880.1 Cyclic pyranopterin monophosphate synthase [Mariniblastus fucicola]
MRLPIVDNFDRTHRNLRISVTDRCNIRCVYCMPEEVTFLPSSEILSFEEIERVVRLMVQMGINRVRLTGGEPLVRRELWRLVESLKSIDGLDDIAMTTNGILLEKHAADLKRAGLDRLNISLDTLDREQFKSLTRRDELDRALAGIAAAKDAGFENTRINAVSMAGITEQEIVPLARFCRQHDLELRFIEFMPLDGDQNWQTGKVLKGEDIRATIESEVASIRPATRNYQAQPAINWDYVDGQGSIGFIDPVSSPFCSSCDRLRLTAEGKLRNCLFSTIEWDVRNAIRSGKTDDEIDSLVRECVAAKKAGHGIDSSEFERPDRAMYQIGG